MKVSARSTETVAVTINELASLMGTDDKLMVGGFAKALVHTGVAKELEKRVSVTSAGKKCKPSNVYEIPKSFTLALGTDTTPAPATNVPTDAQVTEAVASR